MLEELVSAVARGDTRFKKKSLEVLFKENLGKNKGRIHINKVRRLCHYGIIDNECPFIHFFLTMSFIHVLKNSFPKRFLFKNYPIRYMILGGCFTSKFILHSTYYIYNFISFTL